MMTSNVSLGCGLSRVWRLFLPWKPSMSFCLLDVDFFIFPLVKPNVPHKMTDHLHAFFSQPSCQTEKHHGILNKFFSIPELFTWESFIIHYVVSRVNLKQHWKCLHIAQKALSKRSWASKFPFLTKSAKSCESSQIWQGKLCWLDFTFEFKIGSSLDRKARFKT